MRRLTRATTGTVTTLMTALVLTGCGGAGDGDGDPGSTTGPVDDSGFPVTVGELTLTEQPTRIVSLSPAVTEMLFAIDAGDQVVAVDEQSNYPPEVPTTELSGFNLNVEALTTYEPDLVVLSAFADNLVPQIEQLEIPVHVAPDNPATIDDVYAQISDLGALTGRTDEADDLVTRMRDDLAELTADVPERDEPLTYYFEIDENLYTYTSDSIVGSLFETVGLENIADEQGSVSVQLSAERLIAADPDIIFLANTAYGMDAETVAARDGWDTVEAVETGRIVELDTDVASRWGPRLVDLMESVVDAVSQVP